MLKLSLNPCTMGSSHSDGSKKPEAPDVPPFAPAMFNKCLSEMARHEGKRDQQKTIVARGVSHAHEAELMVGLSAVKWTGGC